MNVQRGNLNFQGIIKVPVSCIFPQYSLKFNDKTCFKIPFYTVSLVFQ